MMLLPLRCKAPSYGNAGAVSAILANDRPDEVVAILHVKIYRFIPINIDFVISQHKGRFGMLGGQESDRLRRR